MCFLSLVERLCNIKIKPWLHCSSLCWLWRPFFSQNISRFIYMQSLSKYCVMIRLSILGHYCPVTDSRQPAFALLDYITELSLLVRSDISFSSLDLFMLHVIRYLIQISCGPTAWVFVVPKSQSFYCIMNNQSGPFSLWRHFVSGTSSQSSTTCCMCINQFLDLTP